MNIKVSLTDFVDFSIRNGASRMTKIKEIRGRDVYHPSRDYWKDLRDGLVSFHEKNLDKKYLNRIIERAPESKKTNYKTVIDNYNSFLGRRKIEWFTPQSKDWHFQDVIIRVNPELGLFINDVPHIIKIYFKEDPSKPITSLDKRKLESIFFLMETSLNGYHPGINYSVFNAKRGKLVTKNRSVESIKEILESDALAFKHLWENT
ncbi:hypothetical protein GMD78_03335 [Ornithinibacillus sp. L9]|uniref:Uncharacterized protein n=1 Tax=Ornithinibacillus caprae TaxID=2678566 RepID=A0A6N8FD20_9BACI|nr:hypothetical protein [Ornithinibacillus caprae]MUK87433.1 hypothetical protein [Ornithinibacillus caprae]